MRTAIVLTAVLAVVSITSAERCVQGSNCKLPDCFCPTFKHPLGPKIIPQIVYFGFDDAVTPTVSKFYRELFTPSRLNPNGCRITMSLFVSDKYTQYGDVTDFYMKGMEMGDHSVTHTVTKTAKKLREEADDQKWNLVFYAGIPSANIRGWRSPDLNTAGDAQPVVLKSLNFTYDISLPYINKADPKKVPFPFTLDYGYPYPCAIQPCPGKTTSHKGFWEVPIVAMYDGITPCSYVDGCRPATEDDAFDFLMYNFNRSYKKHKAPYGLNMHAAWFVYDIYYRAMQRFIDKILTFEDVYIVNVQQMVEWMKTPQTIYESKTFAPWQCEQPNPMMDRQQRQQQQQQHQEALQTQTHEQQTSDRANLNPLLNWIQQYRMKSVSEKKTKLEDSMVFRAIKN